MVHLHPAFWKAVLNISSTATAASSNVLYSCNLGLTAWTPIISRKIAWCGQFTDLQGVVQEKLHVHRQGVFGVYIHLAKDQNDLPKHAKVIAYLEKCEEVVQLLLLGTTIKTHAACVHQDTDESDSEVVIRHVDRARLTRKGATLGCISTAETA